MYTWGNSAVDTDITIDYDYTTEAGGSTWTAGMETFQFYVAWSNPDSTGVVAKDGIFATIECTLTVGTSATTD